jgi:putative RNA 2'-phosphotransferase
MTADTQLSKFISMVLRHRASQFDITLDAEGYTDIDALYALVQQRYRNAWTYDDLIRVVTTPASDGKTRFELHETRVRARYGHSEGVTDAPVQYEAAVPPAILYHGTNEHALTSIRQAGLTAQSRPYVHLSTTTTRALSVGSRRGKAVLLSVRALDAHAAGIVFYHPEDEHYLAEAIPAEFINFPS